MKYAALAACLLFPSLSFAQTLCTDELDELAVGTPTPDARLGHILAIHQDTSILGAPDAENAAGVATGAAYIFQRSPGKVEAWTEVAKLTPSDGAAGDLFGSAVSVFGDHAVVGASAKDSDEGAAYIFQRNQGGPNAWGEVLRLAPSDVQTGDFFGWAVDIYGDRAAVSAIFDGLSGTVYLFEKDEGGSDNWGEVRRLFNPSGIFDDRLGRSVSLFEDTLIAGADGSDDVFTGSGSAFILERDQGGPGSWGLVRKLTHSDPSAVDHFGASVSVHGDTAVVGSNFDDEQAFNAGSVSIFDRNLGGPNNWGERTIVYASDADVSDLFGRSSHLEGDRLIVGAHSNDDQGSSSGSAYIFERDSGGTNNWGEVEKLLAQDGGAGENFGWSVSSWGSRILIGRPLAADGGTGHIFGCPSASGGPPSPVAGGTLVVGASSLLAADAAPRIGKAWTIELNPEGHAPGPYGVGIRPAGRAGLHSSFSGWHSGEPVLLRIPIPHNPSLVGLGIEVDAVLGGAQGSRTTSSIQTEIGR